MNAAISRMKIGFLRGAGFLVVAWTPEELKFLDSDDISIIEDRCVEFGNNLIAGACRVIPASIKAGILTTECGDTLDLIELQNAVVAAFQSGGNNEIAMWSHQLSEITGLEIKP